MKILPLAASLALIAVPASAAAGTGETKASEAKAAKAAKASAGTKYCLAIETGVGSHIVKTECRTKAEWAKQKIDVETLLKR